MSCVATPGAWPLLGNSTAYMQAGAAPILSANAVLDGTLTARGLPARASLTPAAVSRPPKYSLTVQGQEAAQQDMEQQGGTAREPSAQGASAGALGQGVSALADDLEAAAEQLRRTEANPFRSLGELLQAKCKLCSRLAQATCWQLGTSSIHGPPAAVAFTRVICTSIATAQRANAIGTGCAPACKVMREATLVLALRVEDLAHVSCPCRPEPRCTIPLLASKPGPSRSREQHSKLTASLQC